ncbi:hypothetical protein TCDM_12896 [Trypanosoma cruzi Dm28c]|uniref:Mucin-associated surface protein (MASP) n=1 Tax=Trypanosoma cruzi Dm28c TaxID=1416333 RepID=V5AK60_TRYCR|nr:hypothetical protein TCDM_12896 [Trypanosoma cruzi Dm28c]
MAMMMTGRVLLACALCVLWCGTSGGRCDDAGTGETLPGASSSVVGKGSQESSPIAQGGSLNSVLEPISAKETRAETDEGRPSREEEESSADEEEEEEEDEKEGILQPSSPPQSPKKDELEKVNESEPKPENQRQVEGGIQNQREEETVDDGEAIEIKQKKKEVDHSRIITKPQSKKRIQVVGKYNSRRREKNKKQMLRRYHHVILQEIVLRESTTTMMVPVKKKKGRKVLRVMKEIGLRREKRLHMSQVPRK